MSDMRDMFVETASRLFRDYCTPDLLRAAATGSFQTQLWNAMVEAGLTKAAVAEDAGGSGAELADALALLVPAGASSVPAPLAETLIAGFLLGEAGVVVPDAPLTIAIPRPGETLRAVRKGDGWLITGAVARVPYARFASGGVTVVAETAEGPLLALVALADCKIAEAANLAHEPRDDAAFDEAPAQAAKLTTRQAADVYAMAAAARSAQMAGALQTVLQLSVQYALERSQFGKPLGKFQAIQHNLATLAGQAAAATAAADAAIVQAQHGAGSIAVASAKARAGEAASIACNIAHQVHGAIGFTAEHALHFSTQRLWSWRDEFGNDAFWELKLGDQAVAAGADGLWAMLTDAA